MKEEYCLITTAVNDREFARRLASQLVESRLAACVQVASIESTYRWMDKLTCENEFLLLIKTLPNHYELVEKAIRDNHPYELPEIVRIPINGGSQDYLNWIKECVE